jgi:hypothetical protein
MILELTPAMAADAAVLDDRMARFNAGVARRAAERPKRRAAERPKRRAAALKGLAKKASA